MVVKVKIQMSMEGIKSLLLSLPEVAAWPEMRRIFEKWQGEPRPDWTWPLIACQAVGGSESQAVPGAAAIACMQISIILVDDILDEDPRGEHLRIGTGPAANLALAFQAAAFGVLEHAPVLDAQKTAVTASLSWLALKTALGQQLDVQNLEGEQNYWKVVETKSTPFYGAAFQIGAQLGAAAPAVARQLRDLGILLGEIIQIRDDLQDAFETPANPDWTQGRNNLPILYARTANHPQRGRFETLLSKIEQDPAALPEAQQILVQCGAASYCTYHLVRRQKQAVQLLRETALADPAPLVQLLSKEAEPLQNLLEASDAEITLDAVLDTS